MKTNKSKLLILAAFAIASFFFVPKSALANLDLEVPLEMAGVILNKIPHIVNHY